MSVGTEHRGECVDNTAGRKERRLHWEALFTEAPGAVFAAEQGRARKAVRRFTRSLTCNSKNAETAQLTATEAWTVCSSEAPQGNQ